MCGFSLNPPHPPLNVETYWVLQLSLSSTWTQPRNRPQLVLVLFVYVRVLTRGSGYVAHSSWCLALKTACDGSDQTRLPSSVYAAAAESLLLFHTMQPFKEVPSPSAPRTREHPNSTVCLLREKKLYGFGSVLISAKGYSSLIVFDSFGHRTPLNGSWFWLTGGTGRW